MTRAEAIEIIKCGDITNRWGKDGEEVEKMAIKALEQQTCEDAVSRQAALDAMYALCDTGKLLKRIRGEIIHILMQWLKP